MGRGRATTIKQDQAIRSLVLQGHKSPMQIYRHLEESGLLAGENDISEKTVARRVKEYLPQDESGPWSVLDADPADARRITPVLQWLFETTSGRVWLSRDLAGWVG